MDIFSEKLIYYIIVKKSDIKLSDMELNNFYINKRDETKQAYCLLNKILKKFSLDIPNILISKNGKPYFENNKLKFNYSHSKNFIAIVISMTEIGIDIEEKTRIVSDRLANKYLNNISSNENRIKTWVKKESYSKMLGLGLKIGFDKINLEKLKNINFYSINNNDYYCSICYEGIKRKVVKINL